MSERGQAFAKLRDASVREVTVSGLDFQISKVRPSDLVLITSDYTQHLNIEVRELARVRAIKDPIEKANAALEASANAHKDVPPEELQQMVTRMEQLCCASIRAMRPTGSAEFDPVQFTMEPHDETDISTWTKDLEWQQVVDKKRAPPRQWVGLLPKPCVETLFGHILMLSGDNGGAQERVANFRDEPRGRAAGRRNRKSKRKVRA